MLRLLTRRTLALTAAVLLGGCYSEPPFIEACQAECACSGDEFACRAPKMAGCDNAYRRTWVLAGQTSQKCQQAFEAYFDCKRTKSVCTAKTWAVPTGACDAVEQAHRYCQ